MAQGAILFKRSGTWYPEMALNNYMINHIRNFVFSGVLLFKMFDTHPWKKHTLLSPTILEIFHFLMCFCFKMFLTPTHGTNSNANPVLIYLMSTEKSYFEQMQYAEPVQFAHRSEKSAISWCRVCFDRTHP